MRFVILTILLLTVLTACNREAADATANADGFLAPASAPPAADVNTMREEDKPQEGRPMIEGPSAGDIEAANEPNGGIPTPEQIEAIRQQGPGRTTPMPDRPQTAASPAPTTAGSMPATATSGKPVLDYDRPVFTLSKTPCYGKCPQYSLTLTNDRQLILDAINYMDKKGKYSIRLNTREYNTLLMGLDSLNLQTLPAVYPQDTKRIPSDIQATVLRFPNDAGTEEKKVEIYFDAPEKLASFLTRFEAMVERKDWVKMAE